MSVQVQKIGWERYAEKNGPPRDGSWCRKELGELFDQYTAELDEKAKRILQNAIREEAVQPGCKEIYIVTVQTWIW